MALVVEDGTGKTDAESYASEAEADAYIPLDAALKTTWDALSAGAPKEDALRRGTKFLNAHFNQRWIGTRSNETQALAWPRAGIYDHDEFLIESDAVPTKLKNACIEAAMRAATTATPLIADETSPGTIESEMVKVGPITEKIEYVAGKDQQALYSIVEDLVREYIQPLGRVERA